MDTYLTPNSFTRRTNLVLRVFCCQRHGIYYIGGEFLDKFFEHDDDGFFEAVHTAADFEIYMTKLGGFICLLIFVVLYCGECVCILNNTWVCQVISS